MDIETRINQLEKSNRLHKRLWMAAACALVVAIAIGAAGDNKTIEARKFILRDAAGRPVGIWEGTQSGPTLLMTDGARGQMGLRFGIEGPGLTMTDSRGNIRFGAGVNLKGGAEAYPFIAFTDRNGKPQMKLATQDPSFVGLFLNDTSGTKGAVTLSVRNGKPILFMDDKKGTSRATLRLDEKGSPSLLFSDEKDQTRAMLSLLEGKSPVFSLRDEAGELRSTLRLLESGRPWIVFLDDKGEISWSMPPASEIK